MKAKVFLVKSFGVDESGGNPAGVVLDAGGLTDEQKQLIAAKVGFSETAFVEASDKANFKVRFFTQTAEVDLCGHATVATFSLLFRKGLLKAGPYTQELKAGMLGIQVEENGFVLMEQAPPQFLDTIEPGEIRACINLELLFDDLKPQIVSTGLPDILLPVPTLEQLYALRVDPVTLSQLNEKTHSIGLHAFTLETAEPGSIAQARNFAPLFGIDEESATGSSSGALACYLFKYGKLKGRSLENMRFEQGYSMNQPSEIFVTLVVENENVKKVHVGGTAQLSGEVDIEV